MQENHRVSRLEEIFRRCGTSGSSGEIVYEAYGLPFEGDGGSAGCYEDDAPTRGSVVGDEGLGELCVFFEGCGGRVFEEVVTFLDFGGCGHCLGFGGGGEDRGGE